MLRWLRRKKHEAILGHWLERTETTPMIATSTEKFYWSPVDLGVAMSRGYEDNIPVIYSRLEVLREAATLRAVRRGTHEVEGCSSVVLLRDVYSVKDVSGAPSGGISWRTLGIWHRRACRER